MEHSRNLSPSWVAFGWFIAAAVTAFVVFVLIAGEVIDPQAPAGGGDVWISLALLLGFLAGGFITGLRTGAAPVLNGLGIGIFTLVVWFVANLVLGEALGLGGWTALGFRTAAGLFVLQAAAAIVGARAGVRWRRGK